MTTASHLVLVGLMGTGKSTVARVCGLRLQRPVVDTDSELEARTGRSVRDLFTDDVDEFRRLESAVLADVLGRVDPLVVAAAGGVVLSETNRQLLRSCGARVVWLSALPSTLLERVRGAGHRPLLDDDPLGTLTAMYQVREPLYREVAHAIVSVDHRSVSEVVEAVLR
jgi:shikimate kinase